jgi:hypothetical protein
VSVTYTEASGMPRSSVHSFDRDKVQELEDVA